MNLKINRDTTKTVASPRVVIATVLAGIVFALAMFGMIGENQIGMGGGHASLAASHFAGLSGSHVLGLVALGLSAASFGLSLGQKSYLVAGLMLLAAGILYAVHLVPFMGDHQVVVFPGPVVGVFIGHVILGLGAATVIGSARTRLVQSPNK